MKRAVASLAILAFVAGCSGGGTNGGSLLPGMGPNVRAAGGRLSSDGRHRIVDVHVTMRIPKRHRRHHANLHPATISALTRSVAFTVNSGAAQVFNTTTSSPNCKVTSSGTLCTFSVKAPPGLDTFIVTTYSAVSAGGTALDRAVAKINILTGKANAPTIKLGPVVSTTADSGVGSLRYALGTANSNDTILFTIPTTAKITVLSPLTLSTNVSITGPGVTGVKGLTLSGGGTQQIIVVKGGVTATITGLVFTAGLATQTDQPGGAIYSEGSVTLSNDAFTANGSQVDSPYLHVRHHAQRPRHKHRRVERPRILHPHACTTAYYYAGAVYNHGNMIVSNSTFDSNKLQGVFGCTYTYGGAIYTDEYGTLTSSGNVYSNNSAYYGGAVYVDASYGQASFTNDQFTGNFGCSTTTGCPLSGCGTATSNCTSYPIGYGGAIYDADGPGITVTDSKFVSNVAGGVFGSSFGEGGALYLGTGSPSITGSTFTSNLAGGGTANCSSGDGGAIYEAASNTLELDNDVFSSNKASGDDDSYGGAIYNDGETDNGSGNTFTSNQAYASGGLCRPSAYAAGGALYAYYGITMSSSKFTSNFAKGNYEAYGGVIYLDEPSMLTGDTFTSNSAVATGLNGTTGSYAYGGVVDGDDSLRVSSSTFTSNTATALSGLGYEAYGGALYLDSGSFTSNANTFASNSAKTSAASGTTVYGGAVYADTTYVANGDKYTSNSATGATEVYGGALSIRNSYGVSNATFTSNSVKATAGNAYGGALDLESSGTVASSSFSGNSVSATGYTDAYEHGGGAIYDDDTTSTLNGLSVSGNTVSGGSGGGILENASTEYLNNSTISGNTASSVGDYGGGGGIYGYDVLSMTNTTVSGNTAAISGSWAGGGGIYVDDTSTVQGSTISANKVTGSGTHSGGGGMFSYDSGTYINDTITGNSSTVDGGGFDAYSSYAVLFYNVTMYQNKATGKGGNLFNDNNASPYVTLANTIVAGGTAGTGGGADVYNSGTMTSLGYNILQTAQVGGGTFTPATGDKTANPLLLALTNNGGPTFTNADQATSPGKAAIPWTSASGGTCGAVSSMSVDQRNYTRGTGGKCDVGAYEYSGTPSAIKVRPHAKLRPDPRKHPRHNRRRHVSPRAR